MKIIYFILYKNLFWKQNTIKKLIFFSIFGPFFFKNSFIFICHFWGPSNANGSFLYSKNFRHYFLKRNIFNLGVPFFAPHFLKFYYNMHYSPKTEYPLFILIFFLAISIFSYFLKLFPI